MRFGLVILVVCTVLQTARAADRTGSIAILDDANSERIADLDRRLREQLPQLDVRHSVVAEDPTSDLLSHARSLYRDMEFSRCASKLSAVADAAVQAQLPTPPVIKALAELELWQGACLLLDGKRLEASERFHFARALSPNIEPDKIFPPDVVQLFSKSQHAMQDVAVNVRTFPGDARLWIDGVRHDAPVTIEPGLHYVVLERSDLVRVGQIVRIVRAAPEITIELRQPLPTPRLTEAVSRRLSIGRLTDAEGAAVARALGHTLFTVRIEDDQLVSDRFDATGTPPWHLPRSPSAAAMIKTICGIEHACAESTAEARATKPVWRRPWFWVLIGATVAASVSVAAGVGVAAAEPRDYVPRIR
jgi:hypothetical protein